MLVGLGITAKDITQQQAQRIAQNFLQKSGGAKRALSKEIGRASCRERV